MSDTFDMTTIVFALLALFVLFKLRSVLGTRTGNERSPFNPFSRPDQQNADVNSKAGTSKITRLPGSTTPPGAGDDRSAATNPWEKFAEPNAWQGLITITTIDPTFNAQTFLTGSKSAYEMIVVAFAAGDKKTLHDLLAPDVFEGFLQAIASRESKGEKIETTFVSIENAVIEDVNVRNSIVQVTVRFLSKIITVTKDHENKVIDGNPEKVVDITDVWTFSRDTTSPDPNWKLIATETGHK